MTRFDHVADEGVRNYLSSPPEDDFNVAAKQLACASKHMMVDGQGKMLPLSAYEPRFEVYEEACMYYGFLNLEGVHKALRKFWGM